MKAHLLYVEDDESLSFVTRDNLESQGYKITYCANGQQALDIIRRESFDLCILDVMLPGVDGFTIAEAIRQTDTQVPIIFLTARSLKEDRLHGLKLGADDYLTKPFSIEELILKIEIFLRRSKISGPSTQTSFMMGIYTFDYKNLILKAEGFNKVLTQREADLLYLLFQHKNEVIKRNVILEKLWGEDDFFMGRSLDVFISRLRKYLSKDEGLRVENIHGVGFRFVVN
jgi:two-component system, OmpR family, response regulator VicR